MVDAHTSNGFRFIRELSGYRIDPYNLEFVITKTPNAADDLTKQIISTLQSKEDKDDISVKILYLLSTQEEKFFSIHQENQIKKGTYPELETELQNTLRKVLGDCGLDFIDPQQLFNAKLDMRRNKYLQLVSTPKKTKWGKSKIILNSRKNEKTSYHYYLPRMDAKDAKLEYERWVNGFENSIEGVDGVSIVEFKNQNDGNCKEMCPVFELPNILGKTLNQLFLDPRNDEYICNAIMKKISQGTEKDIPGISDIKNTNVDLMLSQFEFIRNLFPRIRQNWDSLPIEARFFCYQSFENIAQNEFRVRHMVNRKNYSQIHGDEWGNNFHLSDKTKQLVSIDFDDTIQMDSTDHKHSIELLSEKRNSHLYKRIWMSTTGSEFNQYTEDNFHPPDKTSLHAGFDVNRSYGRLVCSLIQYWLLKSPTGVTKISKFEKERMINLFKRFKGSFEKKKTCYGWFGLSIIDWAIEWGINERRGVGNQKFPQMKEFVNILSEVFYDKNKQLKFRSKLVTKFEEEFFEFDSGKLSRYFDYTTCYDTLHEEWQVKRADIFTFQPTALQQDEDSKEWCKVIALFEKMSEVNREANDEWKELFEAEKQNVLLLFREINQLYFRRHCLGELMQVEDLENLRQSLTQSGVIPELLGKNFEKEIIQSLN